MAKNNDFLHRKLVELANDWRAVKDKALSYNRKRTDRSAELGEYLCKACDAFDRGETVGVASNRKELYASIRVKRRWAEKLVERHRNPDKKKSAPSVRIVTLKENDVVKVGEKKFTLSRASGGFRLIPIKEPTQKGNEEKWSDVIEYAGEIADQIKYESPAVKEKIPATKNAVWAALAKQKKENDTITLPEPTEQMKAASKKSKPVNERKEYDKKFKATKRIAKHYIEMFKEFQAVSDGYAGLLELYPNSDLANKANRPYGIQNIALPPTENKFLAAHDAALEEFNKLLDEGIAKGWMTTEPKKKHPAVVALEEAIEGADVPVEC